MWVEDRLITFIEFLVIIVVILGLMGSALTLQSAVGAGALVLLFLLLVAIPFLPRVGDAVKRRQMLRNDIAGYMATIERDDNAAYPHRKLGDIYAEHEDWDRAIEHYSAYVHKVEAKPDVRHRLERALAARRRRDIGLRLCPSCGAENPRDFTRCQQCGSYLKGLREFADVLTTPEMMVRWKWLILVFFIPGLVLGLLGSVIPPVVSLVLLSASVIATIVFLYGRAREERAKIVRETVTLQARGAASMVESAHVRGLDEKVGDG
jgi:ribosomal protein L40E